MNVKTAARARRHNRIRSRMTGTAMKPRLVVYRSLKATYVQAVDDTTGRVIAATSDLHSKEKARPLDRARAAGKKLGEMLRDKKVTVAMYDRAGYQYHGRVKAVAEGIRESGIVL